MLAPLLRSVYTSVIRLINLSQTQVNQGCAMVKRNWCQDINSTDEPFFPGAHEQEPQQHGLHHPLRLIIVISPTKLVNACLGGGDSIDVLNLRLELERKFKAGVKDALGTRFLVVG